MSNLTRQRLLPAPLPTWSRTGLIVVQKTRDAIAENGGDPAMAGGLQSVCWGSAAVGGLISAYFSGSLLKTMSPREVFGIASVLPLAVGGMSLLFEEEPRPRDDVPRDGPGAVGGGQAPAVVIVSAVAIILVPPPLPPADRIPSLLLGCSRRGTSRRRPGHTSREDDSHRRPRTSRLARPRHRTSHPRPTRSPRAPSAARASG